MLDSEKLTHETQLIQLAIEGQKQAFGELYEHYVKQIWRYVYHRLSSAVEADDMTETVFLKAWENLPTFGRHNRGLNFRAWLYRIAHNAVIDFHRKKTFDQPVNEALLRVYPASLEKDCPSDEISREELIKALGTLDAISQHILISRFINGLGIGEIASSLSISEGNVRVIQYRALKKLRQLLGEENE